MSSKFDHQIQTQFYKSRKPHTRDKVSEVGWIGLIDYGIEDCIV
jgi:hypothetical protein